MFIYFIMLENKSVAVVIPAFDVERHIRAVIDTIPQFVDKIYVIDDASTDGTREITQEIVARVGKRIALIRHERNRGVGATIVSGYTQAVGDGIEIVAVMAGDGQMDPAELIRLCRPIADGQADYVKGNRFFYGNAWQVMPRYRFLGNAVLSLLTKIASGYWKLADFQCGYTAISGETLRRLPLKKLYPRYGFPNDLLVNLNILGAVVKEIPVKPIYDGQRSGIRLWKVVPRISLLLAGGFFRRLKEKYVIRDFHPLVFFYLFGGLSSLFGLAFGLYLIAYRLFSGPVSETSALFAALFFLFGTQSLFFAMWFDMDYNRPLQR